MWTTLYINLQCGTIMPNYQLDYTLIWKKKTFIQLMKLLKNLAFPLSLFDVWLPLVN